MAKSKKTTSPTNTVVEEQTTSEQLTQDTDENVQEGPKPIGQLFNTINYNNMDDLNSFIENLTPDQGLYILVQAARASHTRGAFNIEESETVSKAIRTLTSPASEHQEPTGEPEVKTEG